MTEEKPFPYLGFGIKTGWCPRRETARELAERWLALIARLKSFDPVLSSWWDWTDLSDIEPLKSDVGPLAARIEANGLRREDGSPDLAVENGRLVEVFPYHVSASNGPAEGLEGRHHILLDAWAGSGWGGTLPHTLDLQTDMLVRSAPCFASYMIARELLLAMIEVFEADKGMAFPQRLMRFWNTRHDGDLAHLFPAWISYVGPRFAHLVRPPVAAIVERRLDGGLLMSATTDPFDVENAVHLETSRQIAEGARDFRWRSEGWLANDLRR